MDGLIDDKCIFKRIKEQVKEAYPSSEVMAIGSRARGHSYTKKFDFDILIYHPDGKGVVDRELLLNKFKSHFNGEVDEFGKSIVVDIFLYTRKKFDDVLKYIPYAKLL